MYLCMSCGEEALCSPELAAERAAHAETRAELERARVMRGRQAETILEQRTALEAERAETARLRGLLKQTYDELMKLEGWAPDCLCEEFEK
jgi:hypothetical protein